MRIAHFDADLKHPQRIPHAFSCTYHYQRIMTTIKTSDTQTTIIPTLLQTPALTNSTWNTPTSAVQRRDLFLATPAQDEEEGDASTSFIIPSASYDVKVRRARRMSAGRV